MFLVGDIGWFGFISIIHVHYTIPQPRSPRVCVEPRAGGGGAGEVAGDGQDQQLVGR